MTETLDPKLDVVFKALLADERNQNTLVSIVNAVLSPQSPVKVARVLNPELPKEMPVEKGIVLDVAVELMDGRRVDVEMECGALIGLWPRVLYYWARLYLAQLGVGEEYVTLKPCISIVFLARRTFETERWHGTFRVLEVHDGTELSDGHLEAHVIELPKVPREMAGADESSLLRWSRFLAVETDEERRKLAMSDPALREAYEQLERLSADPKMQDLAREREVSLKMYQHTLAATREEGHEEGRKEGRKEGERRVVRRLLEKRFGPLSEQAAARLDAADTPALEQFAERALTADSLEEALRDE